MEGLKQELELLFELQNYDIRISDINKQIDSVPSLIEQKNIILESKKFVLNEMKKKYVDLVSLKKEKESLLDDKEKTIEKHSLGLNTVKSNDTYQVFLLELEKAKADKNVLEDELLVLMEKAGEESAKIKATENEFQKFEENIKKEITDIKNNANKLKEEAIALENEREEHKLKVSKLVLFHYERLKERRDARVLVAVDGESCGGCGMLLRTQLINQILKEQELVFCDNCSRILFKK